MQSAARFFRFMLTKGLILGVGLIAWALWRSFWPGHLWAELIGIIALVTWFALVWLTTISRYVRFYGELTLGRCLWLGAGMAFTAIVLFSAFLLIQLEPNLPTAPALILSEAAWLNEQSYPIIVVSTIGLTLLVGAIHWFTNNWQDPGEVDF